MIDSTKVSHNWFTRWFIRYINFCHGSYPGKNPGEIVDKPVNPVYEFFYRYWLWPFEQTNCVCCNTVRGLIYGGTVGFILGKFL